MAEAHVRIDEGIKRGPRKPLEARRRSAKADLGTWVIPEGLSPRTVLERYLTESTTSQIAQEYGLSRKALVKWLRESEPEGWKQAQVIRALCRKDDAEEGIESACDALSLARAREMLKSGQWDLERLDSAMFGQKTEINIQADIRVQVDHALSESALELAKRIRSPKLITDEGPAGGGS